MSWARRYCESSSSSSISFKYVPGCTGVICFLAIVILMVVHYFYLLRVACPPKKADSPLVINPDAMLTLPISLQCFKSVRGWQTKIFQYGGSIYRVELHERALLNKGRALPRAPPMENSLGFPAAERLNHWSIVNNAFTRRQGLNKGET